MECYDEKVCDAPSSARYGFAILKRGRSCSLATGLFDFMAIVMKFGGTSVADAAAFDNVARVVASEHKATPVVVVSAMSGVTDSLLNATKIAGLPRRCASSCAQKALQTRATR